MLTENLKNAFSVDNLKQAWLWTRTNPDAQYKSYFRHIYKAYSLAIDERIEDLHRRLKSGTYKPVHATKIYLPKKSGILRPYTLLSIEDQILYQALANVIAEKLFPKVRRGYLVTTFGHMYAGKRSLFFYKKWQEGYKAYAKALHNAYDAGYECAASFDLTACYDSIDHRVLSHFLNDIGLEKEFIDYFCAKLRHWSAASHEKPIYQGHGIPQGPQPSGLVSECVLRYFDQHMEMKTKVKYFRYVDDIRLLAQTKSSLRAQLINLDMLSKNIGLFPQSGKIDIHKIRSINEEIKNISNPPEFVVRSEAPDQKKIFERIVELSPRYVAKNDTRFRYVLGAAKPSSKLHLRLLEILKKQPHLYSSIFRNISKSRQLSKNVSRECIRILRQNTLYAAFTSNFIKALHGHIHESGRLSLINFCKKYYKTKNAQLKVAVSQCLIDAQSLNYSQKQNLIKFNIWWARTYIALFLREDFIGKPSYETLINKLLRDDVADVSMVASDCCIKSGLKVQKPTKDINKLAQISLKQAGMIGKISADDLFIRDAVVGILGVKTESIDWKRILRKRYKEVLPKVVRWQGYANTDPTAWINITDTINDTILDILYKHDTTIGNYQHGSIGSVLNSGSRLSKKYPQLFMAAKIIHEKRLESDLSHPKVKTTGKPTNYVKHKELKQLFKILSEGYVELWKKW